MDTQDQKEVVDQTKEDTPQTTEVTKKKTWKDWIAPIGAGIVIFIGCMAEYYLGRDIGRKQMYTVIDRDFETFKQSLEPEEWEDFKEKYNNSGVMARLIG